MCTGFTDVLPLIVGAALSAGGAVASNQAAQKNAQERADARNAALQSFQDKNQALSEEAQAALQERLAQEDQSPQEALGSLQQQRADETQQVLDRSATSAPIPLAGNAPAVVANEAAEAQGETADRAGDRSDALARARAFGDLLFNKGLATQAAGDKIGMINTFARANQRLLPVQQDLAEQSQMGAGSTLGALGSLAGGVGSGLSTVAGSGALSGGGGAAGVAPKFAPIPRPRPVNLGL